MRKKTLAYTHMCDDGHVQIGFSVKDLGNGKHSGCPLCEAMEFKIPLIEVTAKKPDINSDDPKELIAYFLEKCKESRGFEPAINWSVDMAISKRILKTMPLAEAREIAEHFLSSDKSDKIGITFSIAMSVHSINAYRLNKSGSRGGGINAERARFARVRAGGQRSDPQAGAVHQKQIVGPRTESMDGETWEVPALEDREAR